MYSLYEANTFSLIDKSEDEYDIICTMITYLQAYTDISFIIKTYDKEQQCDVTRYIRNIAQYYNYCKEYEDKQLKNMSCCDLKRQILKRK